MSKFSISLVFLFCVSFAIAPIGANADVHGPSECCLLDHDLTDIEGACVAGEIVGPPAAKWCDIDGNGSQDPVTSSPQRWATCCFLDSIYTFSDWLFMAFFVLTVIIFGIAAYFFLFSGGDPQKVSKAKSFLLYGAIAVALVVLSKVIPATIKAIVA